MERQSYDFVIVGAGSSGCTLANRLTADGKHSVLLLEAGPKDSSPWIHIPLGYAKTFKDPKYNWCLDTEADPGMNGRSFYLPRGKTLGGSSSINGLIYLRGQLEDYDLWESLGNRGWGSRDVLPYFKKSEHNVRGASDYHGADGELGVSDVNHRHELATAFIEGCVEAGMPRNDDFNGAEQEGAGFLQFTSIRGRRSSTAVAFLRPAQKRSNLRVETDATARHILFEGNRASGIAYDRDGVEHQAWAGRDLILCAGTVHSPQQLQLAGIGDAEVLRDRGIDVVKHLPGVGRNLQDHMQARVIHQSTKPLTMNDEMKSGFRQFKMGLKYAVARRGPLSMSICYATAFLRTRPEIATPDVQLYFFPLSTDMPGEPLHDFSGFTTAAVQLRPESRGTVMIKSADPREAPAIMTNYLSTETDCQVVVEALRVARTVAASPSMQSCIVREHMPGKDLQSDDELLDFARATGSTTFHVSGTCKMGSDRDAVVDDRLRVHGVAGLRVVDCSIMPTLVSASTNATAIMIAEKAADMILDDAAA
jgi:choline dehydrogenase